MLLLLRLNLCRLHDLLKRKYRTTFQQEPGILPSLACGVVAAWSGQLVAFPLEMVSRRMQMAGPALAVAGTPAAGGAAATAAAAAAAAATAAAAGGHVGGPGARAGVLLVLGSVLKEGGLAALYRCAGCTHCSTDIGFECVGLWLLLQALGV
jgi:hypothetical protein